MDINSIIGNKGNKGHQGHGNKSGSIQARPALVWLVLAAMAAIFGAADGHQVGSTKAQAPHSPYATQQHKRYVSTYKNFMSDNNFIKKT